jgi:hypothetical protein
MLQTTGRDHQFVNLICSSIVDISRQSSDGERLLVIPGD